MGRYSVAANSSLVTDSHDLVLFHEDANVAVAIAALLDGSPSIDDVADRYDVGVETVTNTVTELGIADYVETDLPETKTDLPERNRPDFSVQRDSVTRQRRGIRDDETNAIAGDTYELSFERALLSEASQSARERVSKLVTDRFGSNADRLRVATRAVPTTRDYPNHVRWISIRYPIDDTDACPPTVRSPPFPFELLEDAFPRTVDVTVELVGERFAVRNVPVVVTKEYWQ